MTTQLSSLRPMESLLTGLRTDPVHFTRSQERFIQDRFTELIEPLIQRQDVPWRETRDDLWLTLDELSAEISGADPRFSNAQVEVLQFYMRQFYQDVINQLEQHSTQETNHV